ncbi:MAG: hypothetical protein RML32_06480 [Gammaproteobacteria bacterium]|nr:hypothetical protein [Gammaproteobacteria bacterium]
MRSLDSQTLAALAGQVPGVRDVWFVEADVLDASGNPDPLRLWTGLGTITWNGKTWSPTYEMIEISPMAQAIDGTLTNCQVVLTATTQILSMVRSYRIVRRPLRIWRGFLGPTGDLHGQPFLVWSGLLDAPDPITEEGTICRISTAAENVVADLQRPKRRRLGPAEQKLIDPTDDGMTRLPKMDHITWKWPNAKFFERG